jgi:two-component sensor histidine kinase
MGGCNITCSYQVLEKWKRSIATGQPFEMVVQLKGADRVFRPFLTRSVPNYDADGRLTHWFGNNTEIAELVEAEQTRALLISELRHRINNMFSVMQAMISLTATQATTPQEMAQLLIGRLMAKSKAHDLVRPKSADDVLEIPTTLNELLTVVVKEQALGDGQRVSLEGERVDVSAAAVDHLALILHELTTNSSKYGALSCESGTVQISWSTEGGDLALTWIEGGGPAIADAQTQRGFGTRLIELSVMRLGGKWLTEWRCTGVRYSFTLPMERIEP